SALPVITRASRSTSVPAGCGTSAATSTGTSAVTDDFATEYRNNFPANVYDNSSLLIQLGKKPPVVEIRLSPGVGFFLMFTTTGSAVVHGIGISHTSLFPAVKATRVSSGDGMNIGG